jgi:hypothetical protein
MGQHLTSSTQGVDDVTSGLSRSGDGVVTEW